MFGLCLSMGGWNEESETADKRAQKTPRSSVFKTHPLCRSLSFPGRFKPFILNIITDKVGFMSAF